MDLYVYCCLQLQNHYTLQRPDPSTVCCLCSLTQLHSCHEASSSPPESQLSATAEALATTLYITVVMCPLSTSSVHAATV